MSDQNTPRRSGGWFTFLLALAAFVMSAASLFQQNRDSDFVRGLEQRVVELRSKMGDNGIDFGEMRSSVTEALDALLVGNDTDTARTSLEDLKKRLQGYIDHLGASSGRSASASDKKMRTELEGLMAKSDEALATLNAGGAEATDQVRELFRDVKSMDRRLKGE